MKVLVITPYVTINLCKEFSRNRTGFGYMVYDLAKAVGKLSKMDVLCTDSRGKAFTDYGVNYLSRDILTYLRNAFRTLSIVSVYKLWRKYKMHSSTLLRIVYYWLMSGYLDRLLKEVDYDMVHIQGCGFGTDLWMQVCKRCGQKFVVTLHGLNSFYDTVKVEPAGKQYERDFLKRVIEDEIPITVISTGMKKLIEKTYGVKDSKSVTVVCNSFSFNNNSSVVEEIPYNIREKYYIPTDGKLLLYVGNVSINKNQKQMVDAYDLLHEELQKSVFILFCGAQSHEIDLEEDISKKKYSNHLKVCGSIDKSELPCYYQAADGVVLLSHAEGFGLSLIEGMHFGVPCMMFEDMDAFEDINNEIAVVPLSSRDNKTVAEGIEKLLSTKWDREQIKAYSEKFNSQYMAANYINVYNKLKS